MERRLYAILSADTAGYSRLMERDEDGVRRCKKGYREKVVDPEIEVPPLVKALREVREILCSTEISDF